MQSSSSRTTSNDSPFQPMLDGCFRANPAYELVHFDRLSVEQQCIFHDMTTDPTYYGLLIPKAVGVLSIKVVDRDTAALFLKLQESGHLPPDLHAKQADQDTPAIRQLVLDGILELVCDEQFVSGPHAYQYLYPPTLRESLPSGHLCDLSRAALQYAQSLHCVDARQLSGRLYSYNSIPVVPRWKRHYQSSEKIVEALGLGPGTLTQRMLAENYDEIDHPAWRMWTARSLTGEYDDRKLPYKLYLSPHPDSLADVFADTIAVFVELGIYSFKLGRDVFGLLRPDKMVAYIEDFAMVSRVTDALTPVLAGYRAQGVPFTSELTKDGMLSWGMDPPATEKLLAWQVRESWRLWITNCLARSIVYAQSQHSLHSEPWQYALDRLRLEGIDTDTWTPLETLWYP